MDKFDKGMLQFTTDFFDCYWRGENARWQAEEKAGTRENIYKNLVVPRTKAGRKNSDGRPEGAPLLNAGAPRPRYLGPSPFEDRTKKHFQDEILKGKFDLIKLARPLGLQFVKVLGAGSQGVACLFSGADPNGAPRRLVIKACTDKGSAGFPEEIKNMTVSRPTGEESALLWRGASCSPCLHAAYGRCHAHRPADLVP